MTELDAISRNILQELEVDGRVSNTDLAARVGLSPSACLRRVQELERTGWIKGYRAVLDRTKMGTGIVVFVMLTKGDEYPIHQTPEPVAFSGSDRNFYDRFFFNGYSADGSVFFAAAFGVYPHLNVMEEVFAGLVKFQ